MRRRRAIRRDGFLGSQSKCAIEEDARITSGERDDAIGNLDQIKADLVPGIGRTALMQALQGRSARSPPIYGNCPGCFPAS